jgi:hypothetical protein
VADVCDARRSDLGNGAGPALSTREHIRGVDVGLREPGELGCEIDRVSVFRQPGGTPPINRLKSLTPLAYLPSWRGLDRRRLGPRTPVQTDRLKSWRVPVDAYSLAPADQQRKRDRERIEGRSPAEEPGVAITRGADRFREQA